MNKPIKTNIFIAHTPLQNFIASKIVEQFGNNKSSQNILYSSVVAENTRAFDSYNYIQKNGFFKKAADTIKAKQSITDLVKSRPCTLFIPHTGALLDNYFFYSFPKKGHALAINFYYEGILYFYKYAEPLRRKTHFSRKLFGLLAGFNYQIEPIIFPADDPSINKIYTILPEFTLGPKEKMQKISLIKEDYKSEKNRILIMGGKPSLLENEEVIMLYGKMIEKIKAHGPNTKIFFKGHHADQTNNFNKANNNEIQVQDITQNNPIEEVIEAYNPYLILSYPSSGLVNLKAMYNDKIEVHSYYMEKKKAQLEKLWPIFEKLDIHLSLI
jgi:hypothetical protein